MALKRKIDKAAYDKLSDDIKKEYKANGDSFVLDTEGDDDAAAQLRAALEAERNEKKETKRKLDELENAKTAAEREAEKERLRKAGDFEAIEKSYKDQLAAKDAEHNKTKEAYTGRMRNLLVGSAATALAAKISTSPDLIRPFIEQRLTADMDSDTPVTRVLGPDGKPSAMTVDDLGKELASDKRFERIIIAGRGSGGGGAPLNQRPNGGGGGALPRIGNGEDGKPLNLAKLSPKDLVAHMRDIKAQKAEGGGEGSGA